MERNTDRTRELHEQMTTAVAELVSSDDWAAMLDTASKFHNYSLGNVLLILRQRPDATRVAGYKTWQSLGRQVRKGERGIAILAPCVRKVTDDDGEEARRVFAFRAAFVFDIAQTDGDAIADVRPALLDGEAPAGLWASLAAQVAEAGFTLERGDCGGANGVTEWGSRTVRVRADVSPAQACKTLAHELAHVLLHEHAAFTCRGVKEVEAESVAYIVAAASGMATDGYSLPYVARWADGATDVVRKTAERVVATAHAILERVSVPERQEVAA